MEFDKKSSFDSFVYSDFYYPPKIYRPFIRWWWPGLAVNSEEIKREIELFESLFFGGFEIQPFLIGGSAGAKPSECHRMAPHKYFYETLVKTLEQARDSGLLVDLTFGSSWPPGGTVIKPEHALKTLLSGISIQKFTRPGIYSINIPQIQLNTYYKYGKLLKGIIGDIQDDFSKYFSKFKLIEVIAVRLDEKGLNKILNTQMAHFNFVFPRRKKLNLENIKILKRNSDIENDKDIKIEIGENETGKWLIFGFYGGPAGMKPISDARSDTENVSLVLDILKRDSADILLNTLLDFDENSPDAGDNYFNKLKPFLGNTFRAIFTDSQEIACEWFWSEKFFDEFEKRRGYDVRPYLPCCFVPNRDNQFLEVFFQNEKPCFEFYNYPNKNTGKKSNNDMEKIPEAVGERIRYDWLKTLTEVWSEEFIKHISRRGMEDFSGIKHRIQTYGMPVDIITAFGASDIPETETLFSGSIDFFKRASSAAIIYNKPIASSETFSWMKKDLMTTPLKWKVAIDRLAVAGINQNVYHGWSYQRHVSLNNISKKKSGDNNQEDELFSKLLPGHYPWRGHGYSEDFSEQSPFFNYYSIINQYVSRLQYLLQIGNGCGDIVADIALYVQMNNYTYKHIAGEDLEEGTLEGYDAKRISGPIPWFMRKIRGHVDKESALYQQIGHELSEAGFWYAHINEHAFELLENEQPEISAPYKPVENSKHKKIKFGGLKVRAIIIPPLESIPIEVMRKLEILVKKGFPVIFLGKFPTKTTGYLNYQQHDKELIEIIKFNTIESANSNLKRGFILIEEWKKTKRFSKKRAKLLERVLCKSLNRSLWNSEAEEDQSQTITQHVKFVNFFKAEDSVKFFKLICDIDKSVFGNNSSSQHNPKTNERHRITFIHKFNDKTGDEIYFLRSGNKEYSYCDLMLRSENLINFYSQNGKETQIIQENKGNTDGKSKIRFYELNLRNGGIMEFNPDIINQSHWKKKLVFAPYDSAAFIVTKEELKDLKHLQQQITQFKPDVKDLKLFQLSKLINRTKLLKTTDIPLWNLHVDKIVPIKSNKQKNDNTLPVRIETYDNDSFALKDWREIKELRYSSDLGHYKTRIPLSDLLIFNPEAKDGQNPSLDVFIEKIKDLTIFLDLGKVHDIATVKISIESELPVKESGENKLEQTLLSTPYIVDITDIIPVFEEICRKTGLNSTKLNNIYVNIEVLTRGTLQNQRIGLGKALSDQYSIFKAYKSRQLMPYGLIGPVRVIILK